MTKHKVSKKHEFYQVTENKVSRDKKSCPKCGSGVFLAAHKDRLHCGRCGYTEFAKAQA